MTQKLNSEAESSAVLEYKLNGDFLNIKMPITDVIIKSVRAKSKYKKRQIEIIDPQDETKSLFINSKSKIGQLADFLGVKRNTLLLAIDNNMITPIQNEINRQSPKRIVQLNASKFTYEDRKTGEVISNYYIFAVSTLQHKIVTFSEIEAVSKAVLGEDIGIADIGTQKFYYKNYNTFEAANDSFLGAIQVTTGKNTKASAIKVIVRVKVGSCSNSIIVANYSAIKRTEGCLDRLRSTLTAALEVIASTQEIITAGTMKEMTYEEGIAYIDNIKVSIKDEEKVKNLKTALKSRFHYEYKNNPNRFSLSQVLSYGGTHFNPEVASERTLEMLSEQSFEVLAAASLPVSQIQ